MVLNIEQPALRVGSQRSLPRAHEAWAGSSKVRHGNSTGRKGKINRKKGGKNNSANFRGNLSGWG